MDSSGRSLRVVILRVSMVSCAADASGNSSVHNKLHHATSGFNPTAPRLSPRNQSNPPREGDVAGATSAVPDITTTQAPAGGVGGIGAAVTPTKAAKLVRSRVEQAIERGELLYWKDVASWLKAKRETRGEE